MLIDIIDREGLDFSPDKIKQELITLKQDIIKERMKISDEKNELRKTLRSEARKETIEEKIESAIKCLPELDIPYTITKEENSKSAILAMADQHFGKEFVVYGLNGEIINSYSPEIFKNRMWKLRDDIVNICEKENITELNIFSLGDFLEGILRISALQQIKLGLTDSMIEYGYFMVNWLNNLSHYVKINYMQVVGNHDDIRLLTGQKGDFPKENMGKVILQFIKIGLQNNKNINVIENIDENFIYCNIQGFDILGVHCFKGNKYDVIKHYENIYKTNIDIILSGHFHNGNSQNVGLDKEVIGVPSIVGVDSYSMSLNKTANAGAKLLILEENIGKTITYDIKLD